MVDGLHATELRPIVSATAPSNPRVGQVWVDSADKHLEYDNAWVIPTFTNGWTNYHATWSQARYAKLRGGYVYMEGLIMGGANGTSAFTLPVGYRPSHYFIQTSLHNPNAAAILYVYPTGSVVCQYAVAGDTSWFNIHGMWHPGPA